MNDKVDVSNSKSVGYKVAIIGGVFAITAALIGVFNKEISNLFSKKSIEVVSVNSQSPDYIEIKNVGSATAHLRGYKILVGEDEHVITLDLKLSSNNSKKMYFFSVKNKSDYEGHKIKGHYSVFGFGIKEGELIIVYDNKENIIYQGNAI